MSNKPKINLCFECNRKFYANRFVQARLNGFIVYVHEDCAVQPDYQVIAEFNYSRKK